MSKLLRSASLHSAIFSTHQRRPFCAANNRFMINQPVKCGTKKPGSGNAENMTFIPRGLHKSMPGVLPCMDRKWGYSSRPIFHLKLKDIISAA